MQDSRLHEDVRKMSVDMILRYIVQPRCIKITSAVKRALFST